MSTGKHARPPTQVRRSVFRLGNSASSEAGVPENCERIASEWVQLKCEANAIMRREPLLTHQLNTLISRHGCFADALAALCADN